LRRRDRTKASRRHRNWRSLKHDPRFLIAANHRCDLERKNPMFIHMLAGHYQAITICEHCGNLVSHPRKGRDGDYCNRQCKAEADEEVLEEGLLCILTYGG
jgi:hypothetical protein